MSLSFNELNINFYSFYTRFREEYNISFKVEKIPIRYNNRHPWLTDGLKQYIKKEQALFDKKNKSFDRKFNIIQKISK